MPEETKVYIFQLSGVMEIDPQKIIIPAGENTEVSPVTYLTENLNKESARIVRDIEREIRQFFRSPVGVKVELWFGEGSLIFEGTLMILSWLGPIALSAAGKALEAELAPVFEILVRRSVRNAMSRLQPNLNPSADVNVVPQTFSETEISEEVKSEQTVRLPLQFLPAHLDGFSIANSILLILLVLTELIQIFGVQSP